MTVLGETVLRETMGEAEAERGREREYVFVKETQWLLKQNGKAGC